MFILKENAKMIKVGHLVVDSLSSYNIIIRKSSFKILGAALSTFY